MVRGGYGWDVKQRRVASPPCGRPPGGRRNSSHQICFEHPFTRRASNPQCSSALRVFTCAAARLLERGGCKANSSSRRGRPNAVVEETCAPFCTAQHSGLTDAWPFTCTSTSASQQGHWNYTQRFLGTTAPAPPPRSKLRTAGTPKKKVLAHFQTSFGSRTTCENTGLVAAASAAPQEPPAWRHTNCKKVAAP